jgi:hypothetical protein
MAGCDGLLTGLSRTGRQALRLGGESRSASKINTNTIHGHLMLKLYRNGSFALRFLYRRQAY